MHRPLNPAEWPAPKGYTNGVAARGTTIYVAGQIGWTDAQVLVSPDLVPQVRQALANIVRVLAEGGAGPEHLVRLTWYLTDVAAYRANARAIGEVYREVIGRHFPPMSAIEVRALVEPGAVVEIEATAVVPDAS
jgi:enamine deaminase RidA (YjgF/YER057c/UK114 family)